MNRAHFIRLALLAPTLMAWNLQGHAAQPGLPSSSVYQLKVPLVDQDANPSRWDEAPKGPRIVSMFYSNCDFVCPMLFEAIRNVEAALPAESRQRLSVGLISLDPKRDTPGVLKKTANQRGADETRWRLYRADAADVRKLAATLGIQYRQLSGGEFNHSTVLILLDAQGRVNARTEKIASIDPAFMKAVRAQTAKNGVSEFQ